jgi:MYXO-CTERM domain-containing protein
MAQKRSSQRGIVRLATSFVLAGFAALLGAAGCSAESGSSEGIGSLQQGLSCNKLVGCPLDDGCADWSCNLATSTCVVKVLIPDGEKCSDANGATGLCVANQCAAGCYEKGSERGILKVHLGTEPGSCGAIGGVCDNCIGTDQCTIYRCDSEKRVCDNATVPDDKPCNDRSGTCYKGVCCAGCLDAQGVCQQGNAVTACGKSPPGAGHQLCKSCADADVCTTDVCKADGSCSHGAAPDGLSCADANTCDGAEKCQGGKCTPPATFNCPSDGNACHAPSCDAQMQCSQKLLTGNGCPDGNKCNGDEICNNGTCQPGVAPTCNDNNPCTIDTCDKDAGCSHRPTEAGSNCDDGDLCNGIGACDGAGKCVVKASQTCNDSNPCTDDVCVPDKGCTTVNNTLGCNDGDPCTTVDKCTAGSCVGTAPATCDDGVACTTDTCTKGVGCKNTAVADNTPCSDGSACSTGDRCVAGQCKPTGGVICPEDANPCTTATCDPVQGSVCGVKNDDTLKCQIDKCHAFTQCVAGVCPTSALIDCNDANPCTADACDPATGCTHVPDDTASCSDGDLCTTADKCRNGVCAVTPVECLPIDDCHVAGECNPKTGNCDDPRAPDETACANGKGACLSGKCELGPDAGEGGAGGEGTGGTVGQGGEPAAVAGAGGVSNEPNVGGEPSTEPTAGKAGSKATGGSTTAEGGAPEEDVRAFVRNPGGCSCTVPHSPSSSVAWLGGLVLIGALAHRRRVRPNAAIQNRDVP